MPPVKKKDASPTLFVPAKADQNDVMHSASESHASPEEATVRKEIAEWNSSFDDGGIIDHAYISRLTYVLDRTQYDHLNVLERMVEETKNGTYSSRAYRLRSEIFDIEDSFRRSLKDVEYAMDDRDHRDYDYHSKSSISIVQVHKNAISAIEKYIKQINKICTPSTQSVIDDKSVLANVSKMTFTRLSNILKDARAEARKRKASANKVAAAPESSPLGKWAWPQQRVKGRGLPFEKSTPLEKDLFDGLEDHFGHSGKVSDEEAVQLQKLLKKGTYSDVIKPPPEGKILMRGMTVPVKWLVSALGYAAVSELPAWGSINKSMTFTPRKGGASTSWTDKRSIANEFSNVSLDLLSDLKKLSPKNPSFKDKVEDILSYAGRGEECGIVMYAAVDRNPGRFLSGPDGLYKVSFSQDFDDERESVGLGPIKVQRLDFVRLDGKGRLPGLKEPAKKAKK